MALPTSTTWDLADFSGAALSSLLLLGPSDLTADPSISPYYSYNTDGTKLLLQGSDSQLAVLHLSTPIPGQFTLDVCVRFPRLPHNLGDLDARRCGFIVANGTGRGIALYFAKNGIAISRVDSYGSTVALSDTDEVTAAVSSEFHTVRVAVDGALGRAYVFIGTGATDNPELRWIVPVDATPPDVADTFQLFLKGTVAEPIEAEITSIRLAASLVVANYPPVADAGADQVLAVGNAVRLDGRASYDVEGGGLTYAWRVVDVPYGSNYAADVGDVVTTDDGDTDGTTPYCTVSPTSIPDWLVVGDLLRIGTEVYELVGIDTNTGELEVSVDSLPDDLDGVPAKFLRQSLLLGATTETPTAVPDVIGFYRFQLIVNDGVSDSEPSEVLVSVTAANAPFAVEPDVSPIWKAIGDEWGNIEGVKVFEEAWRGVAQILSGKLLEAWQYHYNSSIKDVQRTFQRKWVAYRTLQVDGSPDTAEVLLRPGTALAAHPFEDGNANVVGKTLILSYYANDAVTLTDIEVTFGAGTLASVVSAINAAVAGTPLANLASRAATMLDGADYRFNGACTTTSDGDGDGTTALLTYTPGGEPSWLGVDPCRVVAANARSVVSSVNTMTGEITAVGDVFPDNLTDASFRVYRLCRLLLSTTVPFAISGDAAPYLGVPTGLARISGSVGTRVTDRSYFVDSGADLATQGVSRNDLLVLNNGQSFLIDRLTSDPLDPVANLRVLTYDELPVDATADWAIPSVVRSTETDYEYSGTYPGDLAKVEVFNSSTGTTTYAPGTVVAQKAMQLAVDLGVEWTGAHLSSIHETRFFGVKHRKAIPLPEDVVSVPRLQEVLPAALSPTYLRQNVDYVLEPFYRELGGAPIPMLQFFDSVYIDSDQEPPDILWAELTLFSNEANVEDLFGRLVGFMRDDAATFPADFDYTSGVAGLLYALKRGPTVRAAQVGAQILLGQPFAEVAGYITEIRSDYSPRVGRMLIQDDDGNVPSTSEVVRAYYFKKDPLDISDSSGLALNPSTNAIWAVGDHIDQFDPIGGGVDLLDNYNDPTWWIPYVRSGVMTEIEKFHTHLLRFNTDLVSVANANLLFSLITKVQPQYTKAILGGDRRQVDDIDLDDDAALEITMHINDSTDSYRTFYYDDYRGNGITSSLFDDGATYYDGGIDCPTDLIDFVLEMVWAGGTLSSSDLDVFYDNPVTDVTGSQTGTPGNTFTMTNGMTLAAGTYRVTLAIKSAGVVLP